MAKKIPPVIRQFVAERAFGCCEYCLSQEKYASHPFSVEHLLSKFSGGTDDIENLALACQGCNNFKFTKTEAPDSVTKEMVPLFNPRQHIWKEHFSWNENFTVIIGLTPMGRAAIGALKLNWDFLLNQRALYRAYGVHPPEHTL